MIDYLRNLFTRDIGLKLFALTLAVLIWATVQFAISKGITGVSQSGTQILHTFPDLPIVKMSAAGDVRALEVRPGRVDVTVRGERDLVEQLSGRDIRVTVDLTDITAARSLRKQVDVATPPGVTLVRVRPDNVDIIVPAM